MPLRFCWPARLLTVRTFLLVGVAAGAVAGAVEQTLSERPTQSRPRQAVAAATAAELLQRGRVSLRKTRQAPGDEGPAKSPDFFAADAQYMQEMPPYIDEIPGRVGLPRQREHEMPPQTECNAQCTWKCGPRNECDEACEPRCAPPVCHTLCQSSKSDSCETRCAPPHCAVVCPPGNCTSGQCGKCKTVCAPPVCSVQCGSIDDCENVCDKPLCYWNCHPVVCPKPKCELKCADMEKCSSYVPPEAENKLPILKNGHKEVSRANASLDPAVLKYAVTQAVNTPPPWNMSQKSGHDRTDGRGHIGPVRALKLKWAREDGRMLRRDMPGGLEAQQGPQEHGVRASDSVQQTYRDKAAKDGVKGAYHNQCTKEDLESLEEGGRELRMGAPSERWSEAYACADKSLNMFGTFKQGSFTSCFSAAAHVSEPCSRCVAAATAHAYEKRCEGCADGICSDACAACLTDYEETLTKCLGKPLHEVCYMEGEEQK